MIKDDHKTENMQKLLYKTLLSCRTEEDVAALLEDLCTYKEVEQMAQRVRAAQLLAAGKTYAEVIEETEISSATLSRVSRCIRHGSGGYEKCVPKED